MNEAPPASATGFWSIERFVAFVLGPVVVAGSGWLSTWLASKLGVQLSSETIVGIFATGGLAAGALAYKWLHGRQIEMLPGVSAALGVLKGIEGTAVGGTSPPLVPIPPAANDPAPSGQVADAGAASAE